MAEGHHAGDLQGAQVERHVRAHDEELGVGELGVDAGPDVVHEVQDGIFVRGMLKAADEEQVLAAGKGRDRAGHEGVHVRDDVDGGQGGLGLQERGLEGAGDPDAVTGAHDAEFDGAGAGRGRGQGGAALEGRVALLADEVEVDGIKDEQGAARQGEKRLNVLGGEMGATQNGDVEVRAVGRDEVHAGRPREDLDAALLQFRGVGFGREQVVGQERDPVPELHEHAENGGHAHRAGVLIVLRDDVIDDEDAVARPAIARARQAPRVRRALLREGVRMAGAEGAAVLPVARGRGRRVGAGRRAGAVHERGLRLIEHPRPEFAQAKTQVEVRIGARAVAAIEAAELREECPADEEAVGGTGVDLAHVVDGGVAGIAVAAVVVVGPIAPDDTARRQEAALGRDALGADGADRRVVGAEDEQGGEPPGEHLGVAVEKDHVRGPGQGEALVAGLDPSVRPVHQQRQADHAGQPVARARIGPAVHHDHLVGAGGRVFDDRREAVVRQGGVAEC